MTEFDTIIVEKNRFYKRIYRTFIIDARFI